jgi:hypothetical protein
MLVWAISRTARAGLGISSPRSQSIPNACSRATFTSVVARFVPACLFNANAIRARSASRLVEVSLFGLLMITSLRVAVEESKQVVLDLLDRRALAPAQ